MVKEKEHQGKAAGISSKAVEAKTGRGWDEWFTLLEAAGAREMKHQAIANYLHETHGLDGWWAQMVTADAVESMKLFWSEAFGRLKGIVE